MAQWVSDKVRDWAGPDQFGRTIPFAVYVQFEQGMPEYVQRNQSLESAERMADYEIARGAYRVHVEIDTCG